MIVNGFKKVGVSLLMLTASLGAQSQVVSVTESANQIRFEQYTGTNGTLSFWRLPVPGYSAFPDSKCTRLAMSATKSEQASRFMALYLFAKTNDMKIFYFFDSLTCDIISFGMDG